MGDSIDRFYGYSDNQNWNETFEEKSEAKYLNHSALLSQSFWLSHNPQHVLKYTNVSF